MKIKNLKYYSAVLGTTIFTLIMSGCASKASGEPLEPVQRTMISDILEEQSKTVLEPVSDLLLSRLANSDPVVVESEESVETESYSMTELFFIDYSKLSELYGIQSNVLTKNIGILERGLDFYDPESMSETAFDLCHFMTDANTQISTCQKKSYRPIDQLESVISVQSHQVTNLNDQSEERNCLEISAPGFHIVINGQQNVVDDLFSTLIVPLKNVIHEEDYQDTYTEEELEALRNKMIQEDYWNAQVATK